ncbi:hypothetical protein [Prescottella sp. R16]|nr:hypothetical protein [Prescottella sp. R16]
MTSPSWGSPLTAIGHDVGDASSVDNKKDVDQQISAQYLILQQADQNH